MNKVNTWTEKYRPVELTDIVLDDTNKTLLQNILSHSQFPNLLFYGPPGTGKTTTAINLIKEYHKRNQQYGKELVIHLNASDDRGIDIIRNQIYNFINTKTLFGNGMKFIILDEVDYMTKSAQQALKSIIHRKNDRVRYCLICNYISKIEKTLQKEFIHLHFNNLSSDYVYTYLKHIIESEGLDIQEAKVKEVISMFNNDIRSMVNFIQSNKNTLQGSKIINEVLWENIWREIERNTNVDDFYIKIYEWMVTYNMNESEIVIGFFKYLISTYPTIPYIYQSYTFLIHEPDINTEYMLKYMFFKTKEFLYIIKNN